MKIHMRNIVEGAIIRGLSDGYLAVKPVLAAAKTEHEEFAAINAIVDAIWDELDMVIDFTDEDEEEGREKKQPMGFAQRPEPEVTDAVATQDISDDIDNDDDDDGEEAARLRGRRMYHYLRNRRKI